MLGHWVWLTTRHGLGSRYGRRLLDHFGEIESVYFADEGEYRLVPGLPEPVIQSLLDKSLAQTERLLETCFSKDISILTYADAAYPKRLKQIDDPPLVLYCRGRLPQVDSLPAVGVVGTRDATPYGLVTAKRMGYQLGRCGALLISGAARGIDSMAMTGALTAGRPVIGVLGCGVDIVYPRSNESLYRDILTNGCLLSEFPPGTPPEGQNFPRRNRIISGLACGVLIVEAPAKSGALITAHLALDQGRDVFVVPGNIDVPACEGSNALLREGATPVSQGWDVVSEYAALFPDKVIPYQRKSAVTAYAGELREKAVESPVQEDKVAQKQAPLQKKSEKKIDNPGKRAYIDLDGLLPKLSPDEAAVAQRLKNGTLHVDDVIEGTGLPVARVLASLTLLEVKGIVRQLPGKRYCLAQMR